MLTGDQFRESLKDDRVSFIDGERVDDPANHPLIKPGIDVAARIYARGDELYNGMVSYLHDISGGLWLTCPSVADFENEATRMYMTKYVRTMPSVSAEDRMKVFHLIPDLTADQYWGWAKIVNQSVAGGMDAQQAAALRHFDLPGAMSRAQAAAQLGA